MSWIERPAVDTHGDFNLTELNTDEAWVNVSTTETLWLYELSQDCFRCPYIKLDQVTPGKLFKMLKSTKFGWKYRFRSAGIPDIVSYKDEDLAKVCDTEAKFEEFGLYNLFAHNSQCGVQVEVEPVNIYLPIVIVVLFYLILPLVIWMISRSYTFAKSKMNGKFHEDEEATATPADKKLDKKRLRSIDVFRGISIVIMIFVNDGGAKYYFMEHATWDGLYVADLVFPWFLFCMGLCIPVSIFSQMKRKASKKTILRRILIRSLKLIGIGLLLNSKRGPANIKEFRIPGILQRFGLCYFVAASLTVLAVDHKTIENSKLSVYADKLGDYDYEYKKNKFSKMIQDVILLWKGWIGALAILALHCFLTFFLKVPGCPTGYLGPGGYHEDNAYPDYCIGGAAGYIDRKILTENHIFKFPTALYTYKSSVYDPEGLLGQLTSMFQVWLGVQAGFTLQIYSKTMSRMWRWAVWAILTGLLSAALCGAKQNGGWIPINKNLWSISFVLVTTSFALLLLMCLYFIIDVKKWWSGSPFLEPGMNSILLYVGHSVGYLMLPWHFQYGDMKTHFSLLVESLWGTTLWVLIAIWLHAKNSFWSL